MGLVVLWLVWVGVSFSFSPGLSTKERGMGLLFYTVYFVSFMGLLVAGLLVYIRYKVQYKWTISTIFITISTYIQ